MSRIVVDTSVVAKLVFPEEHSEQATDLFADADQAGWRVTAPLIPPAEVSNVIRRRMRRQGVPLADALAALEDFLSLPIILVGGADLYREALRLTEAFSLSTYDAQFVALAQLLSRDLWTADQGALRAAANRLRFIKWIGDYNTSLRR